MDHIGFAVDLVNRQDKKKRKQYTVMDLQTFWVASSS